MKHTHALIHDGNLELGEAGELVIWGAANIMHVSFQKLNHVRPKCWI